MSEQLKGQMSIFDYLETPETPKINFTCFSSWRVGKYGIGLGKCQMPKGTKCRDCDAYHEFYKKADEYHKSGETWSVSLALAREFFGIPCVPEYSVEHYRKFSTRGSK